MTDAKHTPMRGGTLEHTLKKLERGDNIITPKSRQMLAATVRDLQADNHAMRGMLERCRTKLEQAARGYEDPDLLDDVDDLDALLARVRDKQEAKI